MFSCSNDDDDVVTFDYQSVISSPTADDKVVDDELDINVLFESKTGNTVHHAKVRIFSKDDNTEVYSGPADAHVHEEDGTFEYTDKFVLSEANGIVPDEHYILEAKVWGHEAGLQENVNQVEFHVQPRLGPEYLATIMQPTSGEKTFGESMHIHVNFESQTNQTVHHIKVRIYNKADGTEIYNGPSDAHVHETDGYIEYHDDFMLNADNGLSVGTEWVLEAKVWGHEAGLAEVIQMTEFSVQ